MARKTLGAPKAPKRARAKRQAPAPTKKPKLWAVITVEDNDGENGGGWGCFKLYPTKDEAIKELERVIRDVWWAKVPANDDDPDGPSVSLADRPGYMYPPDAGEKWAHTYYSEDRMQAWYDNLDPCCIRKVEVVPVMGLRESCHTC